MVTIVGSCLFVEDVTGLSWVRIVSATGSRWHPACFRCTGCNELLEHVSMRVSRIVIWIITRYVLPLVEVEEIDANFFL